MSSIGNNKQLHGIYKLAVSLRGENKQKLSDHCGTADFSYDKYNIFNAVIYAVVCPQKVILDFALLSTPNVRVFHLSPVSLGLAEKVLLKTLHGAGSTDGTL